MIILEMPKAIKIARYGAPPNRSFTPFSEYLNHYICGWNNYPSYSTLPHFKDLKRSFKEK